MFLILLLSRTHFCVLLYIILYWWLGLVWGSSNLRVKNKKYRIKFKEEVVRYAKEHSVDETAKKFRIHRKSVHKSKKKESCLNVVQRKHATTVHLQVLFKFNPMMLNVFKLLKK